MGKVFQAMVVILESIVFLAKAISHAMNPNEGLPHDGSRQLRAVGRGDNNGHLPDENLVG
jgi:hypothetical protein